MELRLRQTMMGAEDLCLASKESDRSGASGVEEDLCEWEREWEAGAVAEAGPGAFLKWEDTRRWRSRAARDSTEDFG